MKDILGPSQRGILCDLSRSNVLLAFDFDGTLAAIADHPSRAAVRDETRSLLRRVSRLYPCAVITGRNRQDAREKLGGTGIRCIVGNHGADLGPLPRGVRRQVSQWAATLQQRTAGLDGVWVENKGLSLAVHYRASHNKALARRVAWSAAHELLGATVTAAKQAVNVTLRGAADKGSSLESLRQLRGCERVLFVGDDRTDEDVFLRAWDGVLLGVTVGRRRSGASFYLRDQLSMDRFLCTLAELRENNCG